jgi:hypothetical protein
MNLKALIIERFAKWLIGGVPFASLKRIVREWDEADMPGERKRLGVLKEFKTLGYDLAGVMVNLGLELAVAWLQSRQR